MDNDDIDPIFDVYMNEDEVLSVRLKELLHK